MGRLIGLALVFAAPLAGAAELDVMLSVGRAFENQDTDVVRIALRRALEPKANSWWWPQQLQFGLGIWRVPELDGRTRRYDASVTPVWRRDTSFGYFEGGIGVYLLSATINNETNQLPSALQFGSHLGAGFALGKASVGASVQHLSNAGIKQPNGGINFYLFNASFPL